MLRRRMLTKEEEASAGTAEIEVRREDQEKINKFSRLHQKELQLDEDLKSKHKDKEDLEEVGNELELADEDNFIPYMIGDFFVSLPVDEVQSRLASATRKLDEEISKLEEGLDDVREEMRNLKVQLYARFGKTINLD
ncbi:MAG: hypothetical protein M1815_004458 [Lichina confinis]|nr:MAG: hypothetical protein M1815_004458 [Lichina confinis]